MANLSESVCLNHPDTPATARCATCGKPVCSQCVIHRNGLDYCSESCADSADSSVGRVDSALNSKRKTDAQARRRNAILFFLLILAAAAGYYFYTRNRDKVNSFIHQSGQKVQKKVDTTKNVIQKGIPSDSKYKRDREGMAGK